MRRGTWLIVVLVAAGLPVRADERPASKPVLTAIRGPGLRYEAYMAQVLRGNLDLIAQRFNVPIAEAQIAVAKIFPDPTLTAGLASIDASHVGAPTSTTVGLSETIELGGKRSARLAVAGQGKAGAEADLEDFLRGLRATSTNAFIDGLATRLVLDRKRITLDRLDRLVKVNQERLRAGDVGEVTVTQSRVEADRFRGEVLLAEADVRAADLAIALQMGAARLAADAVTGPVGDLAIPPRKLDLDQLVEEAKSHRPDLASKRYALESARQRVRLAHSNRWIDLTLSLDWVHTSTPYGTYAAIAPSPAFDALGATLAVPLPFSHVYRGELTAASASSSQAEAQLRAAEARVEVEVRQAMERYQASIGQLRLYSGGVLADSEHVLEATLYNYQRGGATLLEVIEAQRTANDVFLAYYDALSNHARALVALEQAAGVWDVTF